MKYSIGLVALLAALSGLGETEAVAQSEVEDTGVFNIMVNGRQVGTETFSIQQTGAGANSDFIANGRVQVQLPSGSLDLTSRLRSSGFEADPVAYEVAIGGDAPRRIIGTIGSGRFSAKIMTPAGEQLREYVASSGATVIDEGVAHHYYFLARRTRDGSVPVIIPRENRQTMATVRDQGEEQLTIAGREVTLFHLVIEPSGGEERHVWVDDLGRVIRVSIPDRNYIAERAELPV